MESLDQLNYLAIEFLEKLGRIDPSQDQIDLMETLLWNGYLNKNISFNKQLTQREITCLFWAAHGLTTEKTAILLNVKPSTVESHRKEIKRKLKCVSIAQAVFYGMQQGCFLDKPEIATTSRAKSLH